MKNDDFLSYCFREQNCGWFFLHLNDISGGGKHEITQSRIFKRIFVDFVMKGFRIFFGDHFTN